MRAAPARADPPLHGEPAARRDRAGGGARFPAVPLPVATRGARGPGRRGGRARRDRFAARGFRGAGGGVGNRNPPRARQRVRPCLARRAEPRRPRRVDASRRAAADRRPHAGAGADDADRAARAPQPPALDRARRDGRRRDTVGARANGRRLHRRARGFVLRGDRRGHRPPPHAGRGSARRARRARACELRQLRRSARPARAHRPTAAAGRQGAPSAHGAVRHRRRRPVGAGAAEVPDTEPHPRSSSTSPARFSSATASSSGASSGGKRSGCRRGAICSAPCAGSKRAARSAADASSRASRASSSRFPKPWA